jgi:hypothetical protein
MNARKNISKLFLVLIFLPLGACGDPEQKFRVEIVDESYTPMNGVEVAAWFNRQGKNSPLDSYKVTGFTDADGLVELKGETVWYQTSVSAQPEGFYKSIKYDHWTVKRKGDHWEPWPVEVKLVMKKIVNPHPMYALKPGTGMKFEFPKSSDGPVGFDLLERDWLPPHGVGKHPDFLIWFQRKDPDASGHFPEGTMQLTFSNPNDGILPVFAAAEGGSILWSPGYAPVSGYLAKAEFSSHPHNDGIHPGLSFERRTWVFRVRTQMDAQGKVVSGMYGKIQGAPEVIFFSSGPAFRMTYYVNGESNQRGLEWDRKNNLFSELPQKHWPRNP